MERHLGTTANAPLVFRRASPCIVAIIIRSAYIEKVERMRNKAAGNILGFVQVNHIDALPVECPEIIVENEPIVPLPHISAHLYTDVAAIVIADHIFVPAYERIHHL